jgi:hypothetical protein
MKSPTLRTARSVIQAVIRNKHFFKETTELGYGVVITPGGPGFICRPRDRLFLFSSVSPNKCRDITLNYTMATSFYILRISLIIILSFDAI